MIAINAEVSAKTGDDSPWSSSKNAFSAALPADRGLLGQAALTGMFIDEPGGGSILDVERHRPGYPDIRTRISGHCGRQSVLARLVNDVASGSD